MNHRLSERKTSKKKVSNKNVIPNEIPDHIPHTRTIDGLSWRSIRTCEHCGDSYQGSDVNRYMEMFKRREVLMDGSNYETCWVCSYHMFEGEPEGSFDEEAYGNQPTRFVYQVENERYSQEWRLNRASDPEGKWVRDKLKERLKNKTKGPIEFMNHAWGRDLFCQRCNIEISEHWKTRIPCPEWDESKRGWRLRTNGKP